MLSRLPVGSRDGLHPLLADIRLLWDVMASHPGWVGALGAISSLATGGAAGHFGIGSICRRKKEKIIIQTAKYLTLGSYHQSTEGGCISVIIAHESLRSKEGPTGPA